MSIEDVEAYRVAVFPERAARNWIPGRPVAIPGDGYVAKLGHGLFHEWFGTECDRRCPHRVDVLPVARIGCSAQVAGWFARLLQWVSR